MTPIALQHVTRATRRAREMAYFQFHLDNGL